MDHDAIVVVMPRNNRRSEHDELVERLKAQAAAAADGRMVVYESDGLTPDVQEQFWRHVVDVETAETTDLARELKSIGVPLPEPDGLDDVALHEALWRIIEGLASLRVFLDQTDHLSDRQLYTHLCASCCRKRCPPSTATRTRRGTSTCSDTTSRSCT